MKICINGSKKKVYSYEVQDAILARIPPSIIKAMSNVGWNIFGFYEVMEEELKKEKKAKKVKI